MSGLKILAGCSGIVLLAACTSTGNVERNAAAGAGLGALTGAVIGNNTGDGDAGTGAAIGAVVGGAGGAMVGREKDKQYQQGGGYQSQPVRDQYGRLLYFEQSSGRYYYVDQQTGRTYYQNGELRSY